MRVGVVGGGIAGASAAYHLLKADRSLEIILVEAEDDVKNRLESLGAKVFLTHDVTQTKANLFATIGPDVEGGVVLSGHSDVVPVNPADWTTPPFKADLRQGRVYGRGTADMKGFVACVLAMAPVFASLNLKVPVHIALHDLDWSIDVDPERLIRLQAEESGVPPGFPARSLADIDRSPVASWTDDKWVEFAVHSHR